MFLQHVGVYLGVYTTSVLRRTILLFIIVGATPGSSLGAWMFISTHA